ncbi:hypothetical protein GCM10023189_31860 [Nibrella saemangeumensis]|uniref:Glycosyltransferase 2-like domain-containing protein n=1 Tax=Nibrella saemangeumensis TaxID=1084526 RepID=A0ABP8N2V0_9BACT
MDITIVMTAYNTWDLAYKAVKAALQYSSGKFLKEIIIVDDASVPNEEIISALTSLDKVRVHINPTTVGYVKNVNIGVNLSTTELIFLLDSDAYLQSNYEEQIVAAFLNDPSLGALGFKLVDGDGQLTGNVESIPTVWSLILGQRINSIVGDKLHSKDFVIYSSCTVFRRKAFDDVGGYDEIFEFIEGDVDFSMKLIQNGWKQAILNSVVAIHVGGGSKQKTSKRVILYYRDRYKLLIKHNKITAPLLFKTLVWIRVFSEKSFLKAFGSIIYPERDVLEDKLYSRQELVKLVESW